MAKRSLKASSRGAQIAKEAFDKKGWTQDQLAEAVGLSSRQSVWKFFTGRPIERYLFKEICFQLDIPWEDVVDLPEPQRVYSSDPQMINQMGVDGWVRMMRSQLQEEIQAQCNVLQSPLTFTQPLLEQIYIFTNVLPQPSNQRWLEIGDFQESQTLHERPNLTCLSQEAIAAMDIVELHDKLIILGKPGAGKTTFLQYLALQCIQGQYQPNLVPYLLQLRTWTSEFSEEENFSFLKTILNLGQRCNLSAEQTLSLLEEGKFLLLLDGWDELHEDETEKIFLDLQQFVKKFYKNFLIMTSRTGFQKYYFQGFNYVELADFNQTQIESFVFKWLGTASNSIEEGQEKARKFLEQLEEPANQPIRELCSTPILLNLLCSVFKEKSSFPTKRAKLYQAGIDILLQRWDQARGIQRDQIYRHLSLSDKIKLLGQIAAVTFERGDYFFESREILPIIEEYLQGLATGNTDLETLWLNSEAVLKAIEFQHGLLIERAKDVYSFSHLTFQEYLTARKIVHISEPLMLQGELEKLADHITDYRWREVILLVSSMLNKADFLLESMRAKIQQLVQKNSTLQEFLTCVDQKVSALDLPYQRSAIRAFYFTLLQNRDFNLAIALDKNFASLKNWAEPLSLDYALARAFGDSLSLVHQPDLKKFLSLCFSLDIERKFALEPDFKASLEALKVQLPDPEENKQQIETWWQSQGSDWGEQFRQILIEYRQIGHHWLLEPQQQEIWQQYYRANEFLIECLHGDCQVSSSVRENLEENLLLPL